MKAALEIEFNGTTMAPKEKPPSDYRAFAAGVASGVSKLAVGHPFDTIKVRMQTSSPAQFSGPLDCLRQTIHREGFTALYKGATPPLIGWMFMDSLMLGSLHVYRRILYERVFSPSLIPAPDGILLTAPANRGTKGPLANLPPVGHGIAGIFAGWTVSLIAAPIEHVKARLQVQYAASKEQRRYRGPIDCIRKISAEHGVGAVYHGLKATMIFRTFFFFWWGSYDIFSRMLSSKTQLSTPAINFWAGGLSAQVFWLTSYPSDVVKQYIMTDELGERRRFRKWRQAAAAVYRDRGLAGYWRGFVPCFLRAFPANAVALVAFEGVMRALP